MARKIAVYNKKGGVGKTTISVNLAATIAAKKDPAGNPLYRVLYIDADQQQNASDLLGVGSDFRDEADKDKHLGTVLKGGSIQDAVITYKMRKYLPINAKGDDIFYTDQWAGYEDDGKEKINRKKFRYVEIPNFQIIPAYSSIETDLPPTGGDYTKLVQAIAREGFQDLVKGDLMDEDIFRTSLHPNLLHEKILEVEDLYDYIIFDCPPSWDRLSKMSVIASEQLIIPLKPGEFERLGVIRVMDQLSALKATYGRCPDLIFAVMNMMRGNVKKHEAYHLKNFKELKSLVARVAVPLTEEVINSQIEQVPFAFWPEKYPVMAKEVFEVLFKEVEGRFKALTKQKETVNG